MNPRHRGGIAFAAVAAFLIAGAGCSKERSLVKLDAEVHALYAQGKFGEAAEIARRTLAMAEEIYGVEDGRVLVPLMNAAGLERTIGRLDEAGAFYRRAITITEKSGNLDDDRILPDLLHDLATVLRDQVKFAEAETLERRVLDLREKSREPGHPDIASALSNLATARLLQGKLEGTEALLRRALGILEKAYGSEHVHTETTLVHLTELYRSEKRFGEAEGLLRRVIALREKRLGADDPETARLRNNLGVTLIDLEKSGDAIPELERAVAVFESDPTVYRGDLAGALENYAEALRRAGRAEEAGAAAARSAKFRAGAPAPPVPADAAS